MMCIEMKDFILLLLLVLLFVAGFAMMFAGVYVTVRDRYNARGSHCFLVGFFICVLAGVSCLLSP